MRIIKVSILTVSLLSFYSLLYSIDNKPYGLLTDLIEYTEYTWQNGYVSNVPIWKIDELDESFQYVEIGSTHPAFSWIVPGKENNTFQKAYRIIVADNIDDAISKKANVWDSGVVESKKSTSVIFEGDALLPKQNYFWSVQSFTNLDQEGEWSEVKAFRTAEDMLEYQHSFYPQTKVLEHATSITKVNDNVVFIDFGKASFSQLTLSLTSDKDNDSIIVHLGEHASNERVDRNPEGTIRYQKYALNLIKGTHTYKIKIKKDGRNTGLNAILSPEYIGEILPFRYCEIEGYGNEISPYDILRESVYYPFNESASSFTSSNDTLNQIWDLCKYSIKATSALGLYVDGDRERIPYEADALINQLSHYGVDREYSMARRTHEYLLDYPTWPTEWILQAVLIAWYDYMYTGDNRSLRANYDILKNRTLIQLRENNGLISTTTGLQTPEFLSTIRFKDKIRDIVDWPHVGILGLNKNEGGEADGFVFTDYNAVVNSYHYEALKLMSEIAKALELDYDSRYYKKEAESFLNKFNKFFLNKKLGYYMDGDSTTHSSLHANMFPIAFGMTPTNRIKPVMNFIKSRGMACSVYGSQFLMDALYEAEESDYALSMLLKTDDRGWYNMIRVGSTISLEAWDNKYKPNQDWNHAWGAAPANIIPRKLIGVEPIEAGFDRIRIKPQLSSLSWAKNIIPTIKGQITVEIENNVGEYSMMVTIPANIDSEVYLPLLSRKFEVRVNGEVYNTKVMNDSPFVFLGEIPSGTYNIIMTY